jgi:uncharacterized membrane protein YciS (DUF1049 family)
MKANAILFAVGLGLGWAVVAVWFPPKKKVTVQ